jgi:hypothetical protein
MPDLEQPRDRLAHVTDIHFWRIVANPLRMMNKRFVGNLMVLLKRRRQFVMSHAEPFGDAIAATGVPTVLLTGDFGSTSTDEEFELALDFVRGLRRRGLGIHLLPGNHDVYTFESCRARQFEKYFGEFLPKDGYPCVVTLPGGTPLILVPTVCPRHFSARGLVTPETVHAVRGLLDGCGPRVIVAAHYPVLHRTHGYYSHPFRRLVNAMALRQAIGDSGKDILYVCGHVHRFSYARDAVFPAVAYLSTGGFFRHDRRQGTQGEFTEIQVFEDRFALQRHVYGNGWNRTAQPLYNGSS